MNVSACSEVVDDCVNERSSVVVCTNSAISSCLVSSHDWIGNQLPTVWAGHEELVPGHVARHVTSAPLSVYRLA